MIPYNILFRLGSKAVGTIWSQSIKKMNANIK